MYKISASQRALNDADDFLEMLKRNNTDKVLRATALLEERDRARNILATKKRMSQEDKAYYNEYAIRLSQLAVKVRG